MTKMLNRRSLATTMLLVTVAVASGCGDDAGSSTPERTSDITEPDASVVGAEPAGTAESSMATTSVATSPTAAAADPPPIYPGVIPAGDWSTKKFEREATFTSDTPWESFETPESLVFYEVLPDESELEYGGELGVLLTATELTVDEVAAELQATEGISFTDPEPAEVLGFDGLLLTSAGSTEDVTFGFLYDAVAEGSWVGVAGSKHEVYVVADDNGDTVIVWLDGPPAAYEPFRTQAQTILNSLVWAE